MMKSGELIIVVESVEKAIKFYTEKLAFDVTYLETKKDDPSALSCARLKKGKCMLQLRAPHVEELADFSFIKRCASRSIGLYIELKTGIEKYYDRCKKKKITIVTELKSLDNGMREFSVRDPFGVRLIFVQEKEGHVAKPSRNFFGLQIQDSDLAEYKKGGTHFLDRMVAQLKSYGILRRAAKKYAKLRLKSLAKK